MQKVINLKEIELIDNPESLALYNHDVLDRVEDRRVRRVNLDKASTLGQLSKLRANIVLDTPSGYKRIQAKITGLDATSAWLEGGLIIPIMAIYSVDMI
jgi:hypothetical protein